MRSKNTGARKALENVIHLVFLLCGIVAVGFVLVISVYLIISGLPAIRQIGLFKFLFGQVWDPTNTTTGAQYGISRSGQERNRLCVQRIQGPVRPWKM